MKQNKLISYDRNAPTSWLTLLALIAGFTIFINHATANEYVLESNEVQETTEEVKEAKEVQIITTSEHALQQQKRAILADLRACESEGNNYAIGDGGASVGPFQWQKATFEDKIGRQVTYEYYYDYVTDYERIYKLTEEVYFDQGEWWRWENCSYKIGYVD